MVNLNGCPENESCTYTLQYNNLIVKTIQDDFIDIVVNSVLSLGHPELKIISSYSCF